MRHGRPGGQDFVVLYQHFAGANCLTRFDIQHVGGMQHQGRRSM
jgi:hypothetical protein